MSDSSELPDVILLHRAIEALREIAHIHQPVADGSRTICRHCAHLWPCDHATILRGVEDLTRLDVAAALGIETPDEQEQQ